MTSTKKGEDIFREWHDKDPRRVLTKRVKLLDESHFCPIGLAKEITYKSDKWEPDGQWHRYVHDFGSGVKVYLPQKHADEDECIGRPVKTTSLIGSRGSIKKLVVAELATAQEFIFVDSSNEKAELRLGNGAKMYSTPDKKALLILTRSGPVLVRGGRMRVTSRGIVN